jgi:hypothetical protein
MAPIQTFRNALLFPALCASASGQQTYLDQQPTRTFSLYASVGIEAVADNFVVPAAGADLRTVRWWGTWGPSGLAGTDSFEIVLHDNTSGPFGDEPGATIATFSGVQPSVTSTGFLLPTALGQLPEFELEATLPGGFQLGAGTYWVEIFSSGSSVADDFIWGMADQDPVLGAPCVSWSTSTPGVSWNSCTPLPATDMALVLTDESGSIGTSYCSPAVPNSTGAPGVLSLSGSAVVAANSLALTAGSLPLNAFGYFLTSTTQGLTTNPGGSAGNLCLGGAIGRYVGPGQILNTGSAGSITLTLDLTSTPTPTGLVAIQPGETWNFTAWHRDMGSGGSATSNFTDAVEVTFL